MAIVWRLGEATVRDVLVQLNAESGRERAYTTVMTIMRRLDAKGVLERERDGKTDVTVFRPSTGAWWVLKSGGNFATYTTLSWGLPGDTPVPGDYDGDGKLDPAVFRKESYGGGSWYILLSSTNYAAYYMNRYVFPLDSDALPVAAETVRAFPTAPADNFGDIQVCPT